MNAELLLKHFNRISDAPDVVPRLRRFVLDLAVRGKLVEQNPSDEPASELLKQIHAEKQRLAKEGIIGKVEPSQPVEADGQPFSLPASWRWTRLGEICSKTGSGSTPRGGKEVYQKQGIPFLRSQNVYDDSLRLDDVVYIDIETHGRMSGTAVRANDLLLNITGGSIGRCCIVSSEFCPANVSQHVAIIRPVIDGTQGYLHQLILSPYFQLFVMSEQTGAGRGGLPKNRMDRIPVALPPLEEQQRIVARVDELMALCDRLEAAQRERESRRDQLAASTHHHLNNGADAEALRSHAQFFIGYLPRFTARPDQIKQLRQTILNLAVRGKLVLQNKDDEPVSALVERILAEQKEFIRNRTLKDRRLSAQEADSEFFLDIPQTWQMVYLGNLIVFGPQNGISPTESSRPDAPRAITLTATTSGMFKPEHFKRIEANIPIDSEMWLREGDLLFQRGNTRDYVGIAARYEGKSGQFLYPDLMIKVRVSQSVDLRFVHICSTSPHARNYFGKNATGAQATMPKINHEILVNLPIPLPPLAEQHRIVAKVDELMAWCDQLETNLTTAQTESARLLESVLHYALQALA